MTNYEIIREIEALCDLLIEDTKTNPKIHLGNLYYLGIADKIKELINMIK